MRNIFILSGMLGGVGALLLCIFQKFRTQRPFSSAFLVALLVGLILFIVEWRANTEYELHQHLLFGLIVFGITTVVGFVSAMIVIGLFGLWKRPS